MSFPNLFTFIIYMSTIRMASRRFEEEGVNKEVPPQGEQVLQFIKFLPELINSYSL